MNLDKNGLPVQADGDANDQLQRVGMIVVGEELSTYQDAFQKIPTLWALREGLQPEPGVYTRFFGGATNNVSADQLIAALGAHVAMGNTKQCWLMFKAMAKRLGFAQNYKDGLDGSARTKLPDFMFLRALPLFARMRWLLYPLALISDALLILAALSSVGPVFKDDSIIPRQRGPDDVDDNNTILTLAVCSARMPTPLSFLARKIYSSLRPWNYGCEGHQSYDEVGLSCVKYSVHHPVYGALRWYHRKESGGNPEIAELWKPICERYFT